MHAADGRVYSFQIGVAGGRQRSTLLIKTSGQDRSDGGRARCSKAGLGQRRDTRGNAPTSRRWTPILNISIRPLERTDGYSCGLARHLSMSTTFTRSYPSYRQASLIPSFGNHIFLSKGSSNSLQTAAHHKLLFGPPDNNKLQIN